MTITFNDRFYYLFLLSACNNGYKDVKKRKSSLKKRAEEMNEVKLRAKLARAATTESTLEGASTRIVSEDLVDLPTPASIEEHFSSDNKECVTRITKES